MHFISGTVEGNDARSVIKIWEGYQLECTSIPLWPHYSDGTKLELEDVLSQVLGPISSRLVTWNTKEGIPVSAITTLSEAFGIESFTISITWSWILKQWKEFNKCSAMAFLVDEWVTPDFGNMHWRKILHATVNYKRYWVTSKNSTECQQPIANMKKQKDRHSILPMLANMGTRLWRFVQMTEVFL